MRVARQDDGSMPSIMKRKGLRVVTLTGKCKWDYDLYTKSFSKYSGHSKERGSHHCVKEFEFTRDTKSQGR